MWDQKHNKRKQRAFWFVKGLLFVTKGCVAFFGVTYCRFIVLLQRDRSIQFKCSWVWILEKTPCFKGWNTWQGTLVGSNLSDLGPWRRAGFVWMADGDRVQALVESWAELPELASQDRSIISLFEAVCVQSAVHVFVFFSVSASCRTIFSLCPSKGSMMKSKTGKSKKRRSKRTLRWLKCALTDFNLAVKFCSVFSVLCKVAEVFRELGRHSVLGGGRRCCWQVLVPKKRSSWELRKKMLMSICHAMKRNFG